MHKAAYEVDSRQPGRLIGVLHEYRKTHMQSQDDFPLSEADAWSLYELTAREIPHTTYPLLKEKHNLAKTYGWETFRILHKYFINKGVIDANEKLPCPPQ